MTLEEALTRIEELEIQLGACQTAAQGWIHGDLLATTGSIGWSPTYQDVLELRKLYEKAVDEIEELKKELDK